MQNGEEAKGNDSSGRKDNSISKDEGAVHEVLLSVVLSRKVRLCLSVILVNLERAAHWRFH